MCCPPFLTPDCVLETINKPTRSNFSWIWSWSRELLRLRYLLLGTYLSKKLHAITPSFIIESLCELTAGIGRKHFTQLYQMPLLPIVFLQILWYHQPTVFEDGNLGLTIPRGFYLQVSSWQLSTSIFHHFVEQTTLKQNWKVTVKCYHWYLYLWRKFSCPHLTCVQLDICTRSSHEHLCSRVSRAELGHIHSDLS